MFTARRIPAERLRGAEVEPLLDDMGAASAAFMGDSQLRWLGPEKGVMHMAIGAALSLFDNHLCPHFVDGEPLDQPRGH